MMLWYIIKKILKCGKSLNINKNVVENKNNGKTNDGLENIIDDDYEDENEKIKEIEHEKIKSEIRNKSDIRLQETETRNVLLLGRTRSGKSTALEILKDVCFKPPNMSIYSDVTSAKFQSLSILDETNKVKYTLNIIDTPGLFEITSEEKETRNNDMILNLIRQCTQNEIVKLHCIIIFAALDAGSNIHDVESIKIFSKIFKGVETFLCITRAENGSKKWMIETIKQLSEHKDLKAIPKNKILFSGCYDIESNPNKSSKYIKRCYNRISKMRKILFNNIFSSKESKMFKDLDIISIRIKIMENYCEEYIKKLIVINSNDDKKSDMIQVDINEAENLQGRINELKDVMAYSNITTELKRHINIFNETNKENGELIRRCTSLLQV